LACQLSFHCGFFLLGMLAAAERVAEKQTLIIQRVSELLAKQYLGVSSREIGHSIGACDSAAALGVLASHEVASSGAFELDLAGGRDFYSFT
jgi:hypothetical protein